MDRRVAAVVLPALLLSGLGLATPTLAAAATCASDTTWTGAAGNGLWTDAGNWSGGAVPGPADRAVLGSGAGTVSGVSGTVCDLVVSGGSSSAPVGLVGDLHVAGLLDLAGTVALGAPVETGSLTTATSTDLTLLDGAGDLRVLGRAVLGGSTVVHRAASPTGAVGRVSASVLSLTGDAVLQDVGLLLDGTLDLADHHLTLAGTASSALAAGSAVRGGVLQVGAGAALALTGTVHVLDDAVLSLDDGGNGPAARLEVTDATLLGVLESNAATGTFRWCSGQVRGRLVLDTLLAEIGTLSGSSGCGAQGRQLLPLGEARGLLDVRGPMTMQAARITMAPRTDVRLGGPTSFGAAAEFAPSEAGAPDATVTVTPTGTVTVAPVTLPGLNLTIPSVGVLTVPMVNQGTVQLNASSLTAAAGYLQERPSGSTTDPVTAIYTPAPTSDAPNPPQSTLSTVAGEARGDAVFTAGGLYGNGTVKAVTTRVGVTGSAWVRPFVSDTVVGRLAVQGDVVLGPGSDLQVAVGPKDSSGAVQHDTLSVTPLPGGDHQPDVAPGAVTLGGQLSSASRTGYAPPYLTTVPGVLTGASMTGSFSGSASGPVAGGLGWRPVYDRTAAAVGVQLVDVSPPALGLAGLAPFLARATQRITFAGVDNKTGVASYDVRWRRSSPTALGGWTYPSSWQGTRRTYVDATGLALGWTYCWSVRVRDKAGNTSSWSRALCTTRLADDRSWSASAGWTRPAGQAGFSAGTVSRTVKAGATLRGTGTYSRVAVTMLHCPTCGVVDVLSGSTRLARVDLRASSSTLRTWTSGALTTRSTPVTLRVVTSGRTVLVDAVALQRVPPA